MTHEHSASVERYLSDRFQWAAPGDQQEDVWIVRFCDNDVRDMLFTGPDAEREAWEAWERHAPGYNLYVFRLATLSTPQARPGREEDVERAGRKVLSVMNADPCPEPCLSWPCECAYRFARAALRASQETERG